MNNSANPADNVSNNDDFWEKASIELDIAIDEQNEKECNRIVSIHKEDITHIRDAKSPKKFRKILFRTRDLLPIEVNDKAPSNMFWHVYFLGKRIRGILQNENTDTQSNKIEWLVDLLIKQPAAQISEDDAFQYLLLMLELAECTVGEQSLGFSEKAKEILNSNKKDKKVFPDWRYHCYKALVHYNLGLAKHHMANYRGALREYDDALSEFKKASINLADLNSWICYVEHPALLQKAEVLIKMQFSYNALEVLKKIDNNSTSIFHQRRRDLLKLTCYIDLSDWNRFDKQWENEINCSDKYNVTSSTFRDDKGNPIFRSIPHSTVDKNELVFLNAKTPQPSTQEIPFSLTSQYNSRVLDRAKEQLTQKVRKIKDEKNVNVKDKEIKEIKDFKIFTFIEAYINQCKDNRFDKLTLEETILDYVQIVGNLIDTKDNGFRQIKKDHCRMVLSDLIGILMKSHFVDEIDSLPKPPVQSDTVQKARKVIEKINDSFLKKWVPEEGKSPEELPEDVRVFFKFEKKLINKLSSLKNRPDLLQKTYDKKSLDERKKLLKRISWEKFSIKNIDELKCNLIIYKGPGNNKKCVQCLEEIIDAIGKDQKPVNQHHFTLQFRDYDNVLSREERRFHKHTTGRSRQPLPVKEGVKKDELSHSVNYVGLRRWNSYTPELSFSVGGGHFVFLSPNEKNNKGKVGIGIAVDPGFDFIRNFFRQGFTLTDIDIILLTHGHPDHIRDFPAVVELLYENKKRGNGQEKKIYAVMSIGCYERLDDHIVKDPFKLLFYDTIIVDIDKERENKGEMLFTDRTVETTRHSDTESLKTNKEGVKLIPPEDSSQNGNKDINIRIHYFKAFHTDHSESDSYGYIIEFEDAYNNKVSIGFTGDSKWFSGYAKRFENCNIICSHIGSIAEPKEDKRLQDYTTVGKAERLMRTKGHPYLFGEILFWQDWMKIFKENGKKTLMLMSEFGEEMKGKIRFDLAQRFNKPREGREGKCCWTASETLSKCKDPKGCKEGAKNMIVIPVDVGLRISIPLEKEDDAKAKSRTGNDSHPHKIHCAVCDDFVGPDEIDYEVYSHEEAIFYICQTCRRSTSLDVRHAIYQKYHEKGREIEKYESP